MQLIVGSEGVDTIQLVVSFSSTSVKGNFMRVLSESSINKSAIIRIPANRLTALISDPRVVFIDLYHQPREELTTGSLDMSTNRINMGHSYFPLVNGDGIIASLKENRFDTTDIDYIGRYINSGLNSPMGTTHATIMATSLAGAANSSPFAKGVAWKSNITSSDFSNILPDPDSVFQKYSISVQNHSYGTAIQNYYGIEAAAYDRQVASNPSLMHVFSAGNSGADSATSGRYSGMPGVSNLTGNFKWAKNILTVGATDSFYSVAPLSSRGPSFDGRVKPELVAFGVSGSSGAAAIVSGAAALIQQAYRNAFSKLPSSSLVKAILVNSADDVDREGIDFTSGYGSLNAYHAVKTVMDGRFIEDVVVQGQEKQFALTIPPNTVQVKVSIVWTDPPASVNSTKALVHDLDMSVINSTTLQQWLPWVLSHYPHPDSLRQNAKRTVDTLNNIEQVTISDPDPGSYQIKVRGSKVSGSQVFSVAYQFEAKDHFQWSFPVANDQVLAGSENVLRWQTTAQGSGTIQFTEDNVSWNTIASIPDLAKGYYKWTAPNKFSTGRVRIQTGPLNPFVSDTFVISTATSMFTGFNCPDSFLLYWKKLSSPQYLLYELKGNYLELAHATSDTFSVLNKTAHPALYYAVAPVINGKPGLRSNSLNYIAAGVGCYVKTFYLQGQSGKTVSFLMAIGTTHGIVSLTFEKLSGNSFNPLQVVNTPSQTSFVFTDSLMSQGANLYRVRINLQNGQTVYSEVITAYYFNDKDLIVYPNPARTNEPIKFLTQKAGRMSVQIFTAAGLLARKMDLTNLINGLGPVYLARGIYFVRATSEDGSFSVQKLVVL